MYPDVRGVVRKYKFLENLVLFLSILTATVLIGINYALGFEFPWSLVATLILVYGNVVLRLAVIGKSGYMFKIVSLVITAILILVGIDYLVGYRGWAVNYVMPAGILVIDFGILLLMIINHRNWQSYMCAQIGTIILSLVPLILWNAHIVTHPIVAFIALGVSVFIFLGTLILGDERAKTELKRRFYI